MDVCRLKREQILASYLTRLCLWSSSHERYQTWNLPSAPFSTPLSIPCDRFAGFDRVFIASYATRTTIHNFYCRRTSLRVVLHRDNRTERSEPTAETIRLSHVSTVVAREQTDVFDSVCHCAARVTSVRRFILIPCVLAVHENRSHKQAARPENRESHRLARSFCDK